MATAFTFPPELLAQHLAIVGRTGSGKTFTAKGLVERLLASNRRVCILDPTGVWWGLRSSADGKSPGFSVVVFGGQHADVPIGEQSGVAVAKLLGTRNLPAIIDLSELLIGQRHRFVTDFCEALYRENRQPLHLIIDEADEFSPQNPLPETKRLLHHVDRIVRRGRVRGFRVTLITQRPATIHKNVLTQANALIAMRMTAPQDRAAIEAWIKDQADLEQGKAVLGSLPKLSVGEGWLWAPELGILERAKFPRITTFDSSRTPDDNQLIEEPATLADVDLTDIEKALEVPAEPRSRPLEALELAFEQRKAQAVAEATQPLQMALERIRAQLQALLDDCTLAPAAPAAPAPARPRESAPPASPVRRAAEPRPSATLAPPAPRGSNGALPEPQQRILDSLAWWHAAGVEDPTRHQVAFVARYTVNGHFNNSLGQLRSASLIDYPAPGRLSLTAAGSQLAQGAERQPSGGELIARARDVLRTDPQRRLFDVLASMRGRSLPREELALRAGYTENGHFNNTLGALKSIGIAVYPARGQVALSSVFERIA